MFREDLSNGGMNQNQCEVSLFYMRDQNEDADRKEEGRRITRLTKRPTECYRKSVA
jgi:hypothetical protein